MLELISQLIRVAEYMIRIQNKSFFYILVTNYWNIKWKDTTHSSINKHVIPRDQFNESCLRHLHGKLQNIAERSQRSKWRDTQLSWMGRLNIVRTLMLPRSTYRFYAIPTKITAMDWTCHPPLQIHVLKPVAHGDGIRRLGLWEVIR